MTDVLVVGSGVQGLTTAVSLAEAGLNVTVRTSQLPPHTTSAVAGAIWGPHLVERSARVTRWSVETLAELGDLRADPAAGIRLVSGLEAWRGDAAPPDWSGPLGGSSPADPAALPAGFTAGRRYTAPVILMPAYLEYLLARFRRAGGELREAPVVSLAGALPAAPVVVNCTGIGAASLVPDPFLTPVRGQAVIAANPGITEFFIGHSDTEHELCYVFPHADRVVLGGTELAGEWSTEPDPATAQRIIRDASAVDPLLATAEVLGHRVGLRPVRPQVRLEAEQHAGILLVHNYGHGGAGVTLSWGCAREVVRLVTGR